MAPDLATHNVVGMYFDVHSAQRVIASLKREGIGEDKISFLSRRDVEAVSEQESYDEVGGSSDRLIQDTAKGGAAGGAVGGAAGFLAGLLAFGIPGVGPVLGVGVWATTVGGAVAGATAGGVSGGILNMWEKRYRSAVAEGRVLVGVHADEASEVDRAAKIMENEETERIDRFDEEARPE